MIWVDFEILLILQGKLKFFDGWGWEADFSGEGMESLIYQGIWGVRSEGCERITVRQ